MRCSGARPDGKLFVLSSPPLPSKQPQGLAQGNLSEQQTLCATSSYLQQELVPVRLRVALDAVLEMCQRRQRGHFRGREHRESAASLSLLHTHTPPPFFYATPRRSMAAAAAATLLKEWKCFAGVVRQFRHASTSTSTVRESIVMSCTQVCPFVKSRGCWTG